MKIYSGISSRDELAERLWNDMCNGGGGCFITDEQDSDIDYCFSVNTDGWGSGRGYYSITADGADAPMWAKNFRTLDQMVDFVAAELNLN